MFHVYDKKFISVTSHVLDPPPTVTNCHTFSNPLPLERDVLYGRFLRSSLVLRLPRQVGLKPSPSNCSRPNLPSSIATSFSVFLSSLPGPGASIPPDAMMHFPPVSDFHGFRKMFFVLRGEFPQFDLFPILGNFSFPPTFAKCPP